MVFPFSVAKWGLAWFTRIGSVALVLLLGWQCWDHFRPHKPELGAVRQGFADRIIPAMVNELRQSKGSVQQVAVLHFANDPTDYFTNQFRAVLEHSGSFDLRDKTLGEKIADTVGLPQTSYGSIDAALPRARTLGVQGVVFGKINSFESDGTTASLDADVCLADVSTGKILFEKRYNKDTTPFTALAAALGLGGLGVPWFGRLLGWILIVVLLPVFTIAFIRTMVRKQSNLSNAFVLAVYTAAGVLLACLAGVSDFSSGWRIAFFVLLAGCAFAYNVAIMSFALRLET